MQILESQGVYLKQSKISHYLEQLIKYEKMESVLDVSNIPLSHCCPDIRP